MENTLIELDEATMSLQASELRYRWLFESARDGILILDAETGHIADVNPFLIELLGYSHDQFMNKFVWDIGVLKDVYTNRDKFFELREKKYIRYADLPLEASDGRQVAVEFVSNVYQEGNQSVIQCNISDITENKKLVEISQRNQKLESLGVLAGGIAHDFNNLMHGIYGYIDMALQESDPAEVNQNLLQAMNSIDRARALTRQLLTFAKGGVPIRKKTSISVLVRETAPFALSGSNVSCSYELPDNLWMCTIDKEQISQVIDNIVINARQAMPAGGYISISAQNISINREPPGVLTNGNYVKISIHDSGIGIPKDMLHRIFDPFFTTKTKGQGLGLAMCQSIITKHNGEIEVESVLSQGSTFHIILPASAELVGFTGASSVVEHTGSGRIIVMDDDKVIQETTQSMLESLGYSVICKDTGKDALDFFIGESKADRTIIALILNLTVPGGMSGQLVVAEIRKFDQVIPLFASSGYSDDPIMINPAKYGFTASIRKPFLKSELAKMLITNLKK